MRREPVGPKNGIGSPLLLKRIRSASIKIVL
jgi:hypothetical protein